MATAQWSDLPTDILSIVAKILNTEVDTIRLRSVCSSWRASVRPRLRPSLFPLRIPPLLATSDVGRTFLHCTTIYHVSPPKHGPHAGDPSDGWVIRVSEVNPNRFSLLAPLFPEKPEFPPGKTPTGLNLLDYRISELCKCYSLYCLDGNRPRESWPVIKKVLVLWNDDVGCEFAVLSLSSVESMSYWKFGDKQWTRIDTKEYEVTDMAVFEGKFYAITRQGVLVSLDSNFCFTVVAFPCLPPICVENDNYLVVYMSDLYVFTKIWKYHIYVEDADDHETPVRLEIFKKCKNWKHIECLGNDMFFSADDYSFGFSAKDCRMLKGNSLYMAHSAPLFAESYGNGFLHGVYDLGRDGKASYMKYDQDQILAHWPPPAWLMSR